MALASYQEGIPGDQEPGSGTQELSKDVRFAHPPAQFSKSGVAMNIENKYPLQAALSSNENLESNSIKNLNNFLHQSPKGQQPEDTPLTAVNQLLSSRVNTHKNDCIK
jgi:hypothetical protein